MTLATDFTSGKLLVRILGSVVSVNAKKDRWKRRKGKLSKDPIEDYRRPRDSDSIHVY